MVRRTLTSSEPMVRLEATATMGEPGGLTASSRLMMYGCPRPRRMAPMVFLAEVVEAEPGDWTVMM